jgi:NADH-quinone oxidoreductase subunit F
MADLVSHPDEVKIVSRRFGMGAANLDRYLELDGYKAVQKAIEMGAEAIVNEVKTSNLRGRGGAGFPTGMKWSFVPKGGPKPTYILCNGDESEPGTCKDRLIMEHDPHAVIEGVMIAGLAVGAKVGYIYLRGEYRYLVDILRKALADARARGFIGKNIFGKGVDFEVYWHTGAGAYEVGEESALMESLEGKRGSGIVGRADGHQQRRDPGERAARHPDGRPEVRRRGHPEEWRDPPVLPERPRE